MSTPPTSTTSSSGAIFVMGGPLADNSGSVSVLEGVDEGEARDLIAADPFVANGVFILDDVSEWNVFVDELSAG